MNPLPLVSRQVPPAATRDAKRMTRRPGPKPAGPVTVRGIATELPPELLVRSEAEPAGEPQRLPVPMLAEGI